MRPHHRTTILVLALVAAVFAIFFRTLESGFLHWDDDINVFENRRVQGLNGDNLRWMFTDFEQAIRYKPLGWLAWALVHEVSGLNPFGFHLANVLLHAVNAVLVFLLLRRLLVLAAGKNFAADDSGHASLPLCAALGAGFWLAHPLRVEPVAWVTGLPYGLALAFLLLATLAYLRAQAADTAPAARRGHYWLAVGAFAVALLSFPIVLGFVAALVALDFYPLRRFERGGELSFTDTAARRVWLEKVPFVALSMLLVAGTVYGRFQVTGTWDKPVTLESFPLLDRVMQAFYLWAFYFWKPLLPLDLCPVNPVLMESRLTSAPFLLCAAGVLAFSVWLWLKRREWPAALALWVAHLGLLVPMLGLTERPHYPHDRYSLVNGVLWAAVFAGVSWRLARAPARRGLTFGVAGALLFLLGVMSWRQTAIWHSDAPFFADMAAKLRSPQYRSHALMKLGNAHADAGDDARAIDRYGEALRLSPATATVHLHFNLGNAHARLGQWAAAVLAYHEAARLAPLHAGTRQNLGIALTQLGRTDEAIAELEEAARLAPGTASIQFHLGTALLLKGATAAAAEKLGEAVRLSPDNAEAHAQLGEALAKLGDLPGAARHRKEAARLRAADGSRLR